MLVTSFGEGTQAEIHGGEDIATHHGDFIDDGGFGGTDEPCLFVVGKVVKGFRSEQSRLEKEETMYGGALDVMLMAATPVGARKTQLRSQRWRNSLKRVNLPAPASPVRKTLRPASINSRAYCCS